MIEFPEIEILSLDDLRALPETSAAKSDESGVYFLWRSSGRLFYIGSSKKVRWRVQGHSKTHHQDRATYLAVPSPWHTSIEIAYIEHYRPDLNSFHGKKQAAKDRNTARRSYKTA